MKTEQEIDKAKRVPISAILASKGIKDAKIKGSEMLYHSPFRNDSNPSFSVDTTRNVFIDFGESGKAEKALGGSSIDLIIILEKLSFPKAVDYLLNFDGTHIEMNKYQKSFEHQKKLELLSVNDFGFWIDTQQKLYSYALGRGISSLALESTCKEIVYRNKSNNNIYRAIGFQNDSQGFELRYENQATKEGFKGCLGKKDLTTLRQVAFSSTAFVFEGFFDLLSWSQHKTNENQVYPNADIFCLNTLSLVNRVNYKKYKTVYCYFDNDIGGITAYNKLCALHTGVNIINASAKLFPNHKDYNDFLIWQNQKRPTDGN